MSSEDTPTRYPLGDDLQERERLLGQYNYKKKVFGWTSPVPESVDIKSITNVIDIAAGTCVWILDFASLAEVKERLPTHTSDNPSNRINLYACDLSMTKFPPKQLLADSGINAFEQDITKPFPVEMYVEFDFVHISFLVLALSEEGWERALANCRDLLKPGGTLWLIEVDPVFHSHNQSLSMVIKSRHDLDTNMHGTTWRHKYNSVYTGSALINGTFTDLSLRMPSLLRKASLRPVFAQICTAPLGKLCKYVPALADEVECSAQNSDIIHDVLSGALFKKGMLEAPRGTRITTEEGKRALAEEVRKGVREDGAYFVMFEFVVTKY